ncbi:MAG TPA: hypothetical protein V6C89_09790 [Drouetiella sp.]|jgi:hypothetical protein
MSVQPDLEGTKIMKHNQTKGKALDISGIPLPGTIAQMDGAQTVESNREEPDVSFKEETPDNVGHTYFTDEEARLGNLEMPYVNNKADEKWSEGLADECNEADDDDDEGLLPETQPLHVDVMSGDAKGDNPDVVLRPDNVEDDSAA